MLGKFEAVRIAEKDLNPLDGVEHTCPDWEGGGGGGVCVGGGTGCLGNEKLEELMDM